MQFLNDKIQMNKFEKNRRCKVYSKWSCAFLNLRSNECTCVYNFHAVTPFSVGCFQEVRVGPIKSKLHYIASTCRCDLLSQLN